MSPDAGTPPPENQDLQFEKAEFDSSTTPTLACAACGKPIQDLYFEVNGKLACPGCKDTLEASLQGGSGLKRFFLATFAGSLAAALGTGIYYGILKLTGYEFGLVAIVIGLMVGVAVRWGANGRGGWLYRLLAIFLTYTSIVMTYVPVIREELKGQSLDQIASETTPPGDKTQSAVKAPAVSKASADTAQSAPKTSVAAVGSENPATENKVSMDDPVVRGILIVFLAFALPFLMGLQNVIGLIIIAIGLYEAWKINAKTTFEVKGPFRAGAPPTGT